MGAVHDPFVGVTVPLPGGMTAEVHRQIGAALGFPSCCVEQWIADRRTEVASAVERGSVTLGQRLTRPQGLPPGWCTDYYGNDTLVGSEITYVPCSDCAGPHTEGWESW